jgi:hypothetical protein
MREVVILALGGDAEGDDDCCAAPVDTPRVPVLTCADALSDQGARVSLVTAHSDAEVDTAIKPVEAGEAVLVVAAATDGELRAVVRRLVRRYAPPPSKRPTDLPRGRTMYDLPPLAVLPLTPAVPDLVARLRLPRDPASVADAVAGGNTRRLDLLRTDSGSVTLHGALVGAVATRVAQTWRGRIEVDDQVLSDGNEPVLACAVRNAGSSDVDGLPLVADARPDDGLVEVAVAVPRLRRRMLREAVAHVEVRRARGRAASVLPRDEKVPYVDDGVRGVLTRKRSWWVEPDSWSVYVM